MESDTSTKLRETAKILRTTPKPLSEIIPLLLRAADEIDSLEEIVRSLHSEIVGDYW